MLNQAVLVGRIVQDPELRETENGNKIANVILAVPRSFKNASGEYETDFISCVLWKGVAESTVEYCKKGDLVGDKVIRYTIKKVFIYNRLLTLHYPYHIQFFQKEYVQLCFLVHRVQYRPKGSYMPFQTLRIFVPTLIVWKT